MMISESTNPQRTCWTKTMHAAAPVHDRTLRGSELRYRRLFEAAQDGIAILDADTGRIADANPYLLNLLGYTLAEVLGRTIWEIGPLKDIVKSRETFAMLKTKRYVRYADLPLEAKDGRSVAVEVVSNLYPEGGSRVIQCNIRSIVENERAAAKRRHVEAVSRAVAEAESQRRLTRKIHDTVIQELSLINIRLGAVGKAVSDGERLLAQDRLASAREMLDESIAQCRQLMSDLTPPLLHELGLKPALEELIRKLGAQAGTTISLKCAGDIPPIAHARRGVLFDAARELIVNALKHAGPCSINCTLAQEDGYVRLLVQDDGAGFETGPAGSCKQNDGMGFGIVNTRERVKGLGGCLAMRSEPGRGTAAVLTMPLGAEDGQAPEALLSRATGVIHSVNR